MGNGTPSIFMRWKNIKKKKQPKELMALLRMFDTKRALIYLKIGEDLNELKQVKYEYNKILNELDEKEGI